MGGNVSKDPSPLGTDDAADDFLRIDNYSGSYKNGKRHGHGIYYFANGDIYDGQWRKGRKEGYGRYVFAKGESNVGWFYRDEYIGKEPNEKLLRKMKKRRMSVDEEGELPIPKDSSLIHTETTGVVVSAASSDTDDDLPKLKDPTGLELRRAESKRKQKYFRAKYNISDKNQTSTDKRDKRDSVRAKWGLSRSKHTDNKTAMDPASKGTSSTPSNGKPAKDPRRLTEQEEMDERRKSKRLRESIRAKYKLRTAKKEVHLD